MARLKKHFLVDAAREVYNLASKKLYCKWGKTKKKDPNELEFYNLFITDPSLS